MRLPRQSVTAWNDPPFLTETLESWKFRSERDYELCAKIRGEHPLLQSLGFRLSTELHMTTTIISSASSAARNLPLAIAALPRQDDSPVRREVFTRQLCR